LKGDGSHQSFSIEPEKSTKKRARKNDVKKNKKAKEKNPEESRWEEHLLNQEMDLKYSNNKIEEIQKSRTPKFKVGDEVRIANAEVTIEEIIRPEDMQNTRGTGCSFTEYVESVDSSGGFLGCVV
jgi:hypothetical protein